MTPWVQQHTIRQTVSTTQPYWDDVVVVEPAILVVHVGPTVCTFAVLVHPQIEPLPAPDGLHHPVALEAFSIGFPCRVIGVVFPNDLLVTNNFRVR